MDKSNLILLNKKKIEKEYKEYDLEDYDYVNFYAFKEAEWDYYEPYNYSIYFETKSWEFEEFIFSELTEEYMNKYKAK